MNNQRRISQNKQKAIWYYYINGNSRGPLTSAAVAQLYEIGLLKDNTLLWKQGFPDWKPIWQFIKGGPTFIPATTNLAYSRTSSKAAIPVIIITMILILSCIFGYFRFFAKTPLEGGWQGQSIFGTTSEVMLFDNGKCWIYDVGDAPCSGNYLAIKNNDGSYKVTLFKNNRFMVLSVSFVDDNTIQVSIPNLSNVVTMTRIDKSTAKSMMGID